MAVVNTIVNHQVQYKSAEILQQLNVYHIFNGGNMYLIIIYSVWGYFGTSGRFYDMSSTVLQQLFGDPYVVCCVLVRCSREVPRAK
jgi:hypothetical protein